MFIPCSCPAICRPSPVSCTLGGATTSRRPPPYAVGNFTVALLLGYGTSYESRTSLSPGRNANALAYLFFPLSLGACTTGIPEGSDAAICFNSALSGSTASKFPSVRKNACGGLESFLTPYYSPTISVAPFG